MPIAKDRALPSLLSSDEEVTLARPISGLAVLTLIAGAVSLVLVPISVKLIPLSILAIVSGVVVSIRLSKPDAPLGLWMANLGLGLGLVSGFWSAIAHKSKNDYYAAVASPFAVEYLDLISSGHLHHAMELRLPLSHRQLAGTDLKAYYGAYEGELEVDARAVAMVGDPESLAPANPIRERKATFERFQSDPATAFAMRHSHGKWQSAGIESITTHGPFATVKVIVQNSEEPNTKIVIEMMRGQDDSGDAKTTAEWRVNSQDFLR